MQTGIITNPKQSESNALGLNHIVYDIFGDVKHELFHHPFTPAPTGFICSATNPSPPYKNN